jgi:phosphoribosylaminoimidazolecarboxamide formyltransferase / IMP cyclohydrolase
MNLFKKNALISVYRKEGVGDFAQELVNLGWRIFSSGGTAKALAKAKIPVTDVAELSGFAPILGHRVVTLTPQVHGGLLATEEQEDELYELGFPWIDLVCVDLYPLKKEISSPESTPESVIEKTDIGGPTIIRSAAKGGRIVIADKYDWMNVLEWLKNGSPDNENFRKKLAAKAEAIVADYCLSSARYHGEFDGFVGNRVQTCKYGENAWQTPAYLYSTDGFNDPLSLSNFIVVEGSAPSYNNWVDIDRLLQTVTHISEGYRKNVGHAPQVAVGVKHGNPCGAAIGKDCLTKAIAGDPLSIFGGLVLTNFPIKDKEIFPLEGKLLDGIIAPCFSYEAIDRLKRKNGKCRLITNLALDNLTIDKSKRFRYVRGGFLVQPNYDYVFDFKDVVSYGRIPETQKSSLILAWAVGSTSNSNTITIVKDNQLIGNGVGQQDRVGAAKLAIERAKRSLHDLEGSVAYSDSFFPFPDAVELLIGAGVSAILTHSGSIHDKDIIDTCHKRVPLLMMPVKTGRGFFGH